MLGVVCPAAAMSSRTVAPCCASMVSAVTRKSWNLRSSRPALWRAAMKSLRMLDSAIGEFRSWMMLIRPRKIHASGLSWTHLSRCALISGMTDSGSGSVRRLAGVFGSPAIERFSASLVRRMVMVRRSRSMSCLCSPQTSPMRSPPAAMASVMARRRWRGMESWMTRSSSAVAGSVSLRRRTGGILTSKGERLMTEWPSASGLAAAASICRR